MLYTVEHIMVAGELLSTVYPFFRISQTLLQWGTYVTFLFASRLTNFCNLQSF